MNKEPLKIVYSVFLLFMITVIGCNKSKETIKPMVSSLTQSVYASLVVAAQNEYNAYSPVTGIIQDLYIEEGDTVLEGQILAVIKNDNLTLETQNARLNLELARDNLTGNDAILNGIRDEIKIARLKFLTDSTNYFRQKSLWEQKIGSKAQLENLQLQYETSRSHLNQLINNYNSTRRELSTLVKQNQLRLKTTIQNAEDFTVKSKVDGRIYKIFKESGELIQPQEPLAKIGMADSFIIELEIDEVDITDVRIGQKTIVRLDAYSDQVFESTITKIYPIKNETTQTFTVEAKFNQPPKTLYPGLSGEASIIIVEKENVISIPRSYLSERNTVYTKEKEIGVKPGIQNIERIEILEGLDTSVVLIKPKDVD